MCGFRFPISSSSRKGVERHLKTAQHLGQVRQGKSLLAILAVVAGQTCAQVALILRVHAKTVAPWGREFCCEGIKGAPRNKPPGRPPQLTPTQNAARVTLLDAGPVQAGFRGAGWRSPLVQHRMYERFGAYDNVFSIAQVRKNLGVRYPKAACVSEHLDEQTRQAWRPTPWPQRLRRAQAQKALRLFGDAARFPQWGTLTYPWARRGQQPIVKTSGTRKGDTVLGLLDSFTGCFLYQGQEGRLNSAASMAFLTRVLERTTQPIILVQEGATYHPSAETTACFAQHTTRLQVVQLPTSSPDYNPIAKLWKKIKQQETPLHSFPTFAALTERVEQALLTFTNTPEDILTLCSLPTAWAQAA